MLHRSSGNYLHYDHAAKRPRYEAQTVVNVPPQASLPVSNCSRYGFLNFESDAESINDIGSIRGTVNRKLLSFD